MEKWLSVKEMGVRRLEVMLDEMRLGGRPKEGANNLYKGC